MTLVSLSLSQTYKCRACQKEAAGEQRTDQQMFFPTPFCIRLLNYRVGSRWTLSQDRLSSIPCHSLQINQTRSTHLQLIRNRLAY
jgi:hypothetical protein